MTARLKAETAQKTVGARLARESGVSVDINVDCDAVFAGKPRSYSRADYLAAETRHTLFPTSSATSKPPC